MYKGKLTWLVSHCELLLVFPGEISRINIVLRKRSYPKYMYLWMNHLNGETTVMISSPVSCLQQAIVWLLVTTTLIWLEYVEATLGTGWVGRNMQTSWVTEYVITTLTGDKIVTVNSTLQPSSVWKNVWLWSCILHKQFCGRPDLSIHKYPIELKNCCRIAYFGVDIIS
jgi:hypothetical protein